MTQSIDFEELVIGCLLESRGISFRDVQLCLMILIRLGLGILMAKLKIVRTDGSVLEGEITPAVEYSFEQYAKRASIRRSAMKKSRAMSIG